MKSIFFIFFLFLITINLQARIGAPVQLQNHENKTISPTNPLPVAITGGDSVSIIVPGGSTILKDAHGDEADITSDGRLRIASDTDFGIFNKLNEIKTNLYDFSDSSLHFVDYDSIAFFYKTVDNDSKLDEWVIQKITLPKNIPVKHKSIWFEDPILIQDKRFGKRQNIYIIW